MLEGLPSGNPAINKLPERFEAEVESRGANGRRDPRTIAMCLAPAAIGYALLGEYIRHGTDLDSASDKGAEAMLVEVLRDVARSAFRE